MRTHHRGRPVRLRVGWLVVVPLALSAASLAAAPAGAAAPTTAVITRLAEAPAPATAPTMLAALGSAAAATTPQAALNAAVAQAAARGVRTAAVIADRSTGAVLASVNPDQQIASASLVKLYTAVYYGIRNPTLIPSLADMIRVSRDSTQSSLWSTSIVPWVAARYGLTGSANSAASASGWWGTVRVTARDLVRFQYRMERDTAVNGFLPQAMQQAADVGSDGFDQNFGVNALAGSGSKQGWTTIVNYPSSDVYGLHSVGFTSKYYIAILQTASSAVGYQPMRETITATARALAASSVAPPRTPYPKLVRTEATRFVASLYSHVLGRSGTDATLIERLAKGLMSRGQAANAIVRSKERYTQLARWYFQACLGRSGGAEYAATFARQPHLAAVQSICGGQGAWDVARRDSKTYLGRILRVLWQQTPSSSDLARYSSILAQQGRPSVINTATQDPRFKKQWVNRAHLQMLGRPADAGAVSRYPSANVRIHGLEEIYAGIPTSGEYWKKWVRP
ncbi:MAG: hypothetical protein WKF57_09110 [Nakamurella sp.]